MEIIVAIFEVFGKAVLLASSICGLCFVTTVAYMAYKERQYIENQEDDD